MAPQSAGDGTYLRLDPVVGSGTYRANRKQSKDLNWHWYAVSVSGVNAYSWLDAGERKSDTKPAGDLANTHPVTLATGGNQVNIAATLIYSRVLTDAEVQSLMSGRTMPKEVSGLIGYYKFNEGSGTTCTDHSGQGNHLTYTSPVWETFDPASTAKTNFASGQPYTPAVLKTQSWWDCLPPAIADPEMMGCAHIVTSAFSVSGSALIDAAVMGNFTVCGWRKSNTGRGTQMLFSAGSANAYPVRLMISDGLVGLRFGNGSTETVNLFSRVNKWTTENRWVFWAIAVSGSSATLYLNGTPIETISVSGVRAAGMQSWFWNNGGRHTLRSSRLFSRALSASEVNELFLTDRISNRTKAEVTYGPELVTNGDFSNGTTGWQLVGTSMAVESGRLRVTGAANTDRAVQNVALVVGKSYKLTYSMYAGTVTNNPNIVMDNGQGSGVTGQFGENLSVVFNCTVANSQVWLRANAGEALFDNISVREITGVTPGLVGEWLCNTPHSTTISDTSGNGLHTTTGNPRLLDSPYQVARRKRFGKQLKVSAGGYARVQSADVKNALNNSAVLTVSQWVKPVRLQNAVSIISGILTSAANTGVGVSNASGGFISLYARESQSAGAVSLVSPRRFQEFIGQWILLSGEVDYANDLGKIYLNGQLIAQGAMAFTDTKYTDTGNPYIYAASSNTSETHAIDSARIYNRALTAAEHYQLFLDNAPRNGLIAEYLFDNDVSNCQDTSGNGFHATWSGISAANYVSEL
jgi:hypothetical protein